MNIFFQSIDINGCIVSQGGERIWNPCLNHQFGTGTGRLPSLVLSRVYQRNERRLGWCALSITAPPTDWAFLLEGSKAGRGAQVHRAGGLCSTSCVCSHNCDLPVWPHLASPLPKQGLEEGMLQGAGHSNILLFAQPTVRNIFLVRLCLIHSCSPETFLHRFIYL